MCVTAGGTPPPNTNASIGRRLPRSTDERKVKSRDAARERRAREADCFQELEDLLSLPGTQESVNEDQKSVPPLDKTSLIRLTVAQLKCRDVIRNELQRDGREWESDDIFASLDPLACLDGFCLVIGSQGEVIFASENIHKFVGLTAEEVLGHHFVDFVHPCDQAALRCLNPRDLARGEKRDVTATVRVKCTVTERGRIINLKQANYKPLRLTGRTSHILPRSSSSYTGQVFIGAASLVGPDLTMCSQSGVFSTKHFADMRLAEATPWMSDVARYPAEDVLGLSFYDLIHSIDLPQVGTSFRNLREHGQCWTPPYRLLVRGGGFCWLQTRALCKPARRGSGRSTYIHCQHNQLTGVEEVGQVVAVIQGAPDPPPASKLNISSDLGFVRRKRETRTRLDLSDERQESRTKRKSLQNAPRQVDSIPLGRSSMNLAKVQTKLALSPIKTEPAYLQNSPKAATAQIFQAPPLTRAAGSQLSDKSTRQDKPSESPTVSLKPPRPSTSVIWSAKSPFEVSRPITLEAAPTNWKAAAENGSNVQLPKCSTPKFFAPQSSPLATSSKCAELMPDLCFSPRSSVITVPKIAMRPETITFGAQAWQESSSTLDQGVDLPSRMELADKEDTARGQQTRAVGETSEREKLSESDFFNNIFDYSGEELERLSPHSGDECILLTNSQNPIGAPLDVNCGNDDSLKPTMPNNLCEDFSQFFDNPGTPLPEDCASYFEASGPTELEPQDLALLLSPPQDRVPESPPHNIKETPPTPSSPPSMSTLWQSVSLTDSRPVRLDFRDRDKEKDESLEVSIQGRGVKRVKETSPNSLESKRIRAEVKVLQRR